MTPAQAKIKQWREDPVFFVREQFGVEPDEWQLDVLREFPRQKRMAFCACKGPGKTAVLAWLAWNFLATRPHPKIAACSISGDNLSDGLWSEMAKWMNKSAALKEGFEWTKTRISARGHESTWWMSARSWAKGSDSSQQANTLAGLHADYILFILDESGGIPDAVMAAAEAALSTGIETKIVQAGNPTHLEGPLYRASTSERDLWHLTNITADPNDPKRTPRVSTEWAKEQIDKYGADSPWVLVNVFGKFPPSSLNTLLGPDEVAAAMKKHYREPDYSYSQKRLGIDVARFGDDRTVIFPRQGLAAFKPVEMRNARGPEIAARIAAAKARWGSEMEFVDDTGGYGATVIDSLFQAGINATAINFSGRPIDPRYFNIRAEMWFKMAEWVKRGGALPNNPTLAKELTTPTYTFHNGKFRLEEKDQIKERLGFSPDYSDALALTFALPDQPASKKLPFHTQDTDHVSEFDPFDMNR